MLRLFVNGLAATCSSGLTYLRNVIPHLSRQQGVHTTLATNELLRAEFRDLPNTTLLDVSIPSSAARRFFLEQKHFPRLIRQSRTDVLISAGNFALRNSPVPQILLSGNSLYTSDEFFRDLQMRHEFLMWADTRIKAWLAQRSIEWACITVAPSQSFAHQLTSWAKRNVVSIYHGFDHDIFCREQLDEQIAKQLHSEPDTLKLLFVSPYNYYRNFETLFRALRILRDQLSPTKVRLFLTCILKSEENPGAYRAEKAAALIETLGLSREIVQLGAIPYRQLHQLYAAADIYVTPAYSETFGHPVVEAMACGVPVIASSLPVHQEICDDAALYFAPFSCEELVKQVMRVARSSMLQAQLSQRGRRRATNFSWAKHVSELLQLAKSLVSPRSQLIEVRALSA